MIVKNSKPFLQNEKKDDLEDNRLSVLVLGRASSQGFQKGMHREMELSLN